MLCSLFAIVVVGCLILTCLRFIAGTAVEERLFLIRRKMEIDDKSEESGSSLQDDTDPHPVQQVRPFCRRVAGRRRNRHKRRGNPEPEGKSLASTMLLCLVTTTSLTCPAVGASLHSTSRGVGCEQAGGVT